MNKVIAVVLVCVCMLMLVACNRANTDSGDEHVFHAKVLEIGTQHLLVEPESGSRESKSADKIRISLATVDCPENLEVGDTVVIAYDGMIQELYPAIIPNVYSIKKN